MNTVSFSPKKGSHLKQSEVTSGLHPACNVKIQQTCAMSYIYTCIYNISLCALHKRKTGMSTSADDKQQ